MGCDTNPIFSVSKDRELFEIHYAIQCVQNPYLYDGVRETLKELVASGVKISVATNAPTPFAKRMLNHLEVDYLFDVIIGADEVNESKPSPEMLNKILEHYSFDKSIHRAWMVGDNIKDMLSAKSAGIGSMFATWGFSPNSDDKVIVRKPSEILDIVL